MILTPVAIKHQLIFMKCKTRISAHPEIWRSHPENLPLARIQNLIGLTRVMGNPICKKEEDRWRELWWKAVLEFFPGALTHCLQQPLFGASTADQV